MRQLIRFNGEGGQFEYRFVTGFAIVPRKVNKKIKYFIMVHTDVGISNFDIPFDSLDEAESKLKLYFEINSILVPVGNKEE